MTARIGDDVDARDPRALGRALDTLGPWIERAYAPRATGVEHLGHDGAALIVGNHSGGPLAMIEPLVLAHTLRPSIGVERVPSLLLHEILWRTPLAPRIAALGAVRASPENANALFDRGRPVLVYPGGDREAFRHFRERDRVALGPRRGYLRLAIARGVPIVPVVTAGMHSGLVCLDDGHALAQRFPLARALRVGVLPITVSVPFGLTLGVPPPYLPLSGRVRIQVLEPIRFARSGAAAAADAAYLDACHRVVVGAMQRALDALSRQRRQERRGALHRGLDRALAAIERATLVSPGQERGRTVASVVELGAAAARKAA